MAPPTEAEVAPVKRLSGILVAGLVVLATIWVYNRFIGKGAKTVADLGKPA